MHRAGPSFRGVRFVAGLLCCATLAWTALFPVAVRAAQPEYPAPWPFGTVTVTVPFTRGSEADKLFSLLQASFTERTGQKLEAQYLPGRAGADAWATMADGPTDGSVLTLVLLPDLYLRSQQPDSGVTLDSISICNVIAYTPSVLWVAEPTSLTSVQLLANVAAGMNGDFLIGGSGTFSSSWLADRALARETGVRTTYVPYRGTVEAAKAALNRGVGAFWGYAVQVTVPSFERARFAPLGIAAVKRLPALPDTPVFGESGISLRQGVSFGIAVPKQTPGITVTEIAAYFSAFAATATFQQEAEKLGFVPMNVDRDAVPGFLESMKTIADANAETYGLFDR